MESTILCLIGFAISLAAVEPESIDRIIGGYNADAGQFPHQVSLRSSPIKKSHFCGGSIISNRFVLTAAHCAQGKHSSPRNVFIVVGARRIFGDGYVHRVARIVSHPGWYRPLLQNDICVIRTAEEIQFSNNVGPVNLPTINPPNGLQVTVSGWGRYRVSSFRHLLQLPFASEIY